MAQALKVLIVEDNPADAELLLGQLRRAGFEPEAVCVDTEEEYLAHLDPPPDIVLSDYVMPELDGGRALELLRARGLEIPFVIISETIGEDLAVQVMKQGADDYLLKDRLTRLGSAVTHALNESRLRREQRRASAQLAESEAQLRQSQKMEAIGRLAGGVAHDFNNLLTVILGHASLLKLPGLAEEEIRSHAEEIERAADRAAALTRQLLLFGRKQIMQPADRDLNAVVANMTQMLQRILGEDITLTTELAPGLPLVNADAAMLEQILLNLAVNSRDAMPDGGRLLISTRAETMGEGMAVLDPETKPGPYVCLVLEDTGSGIPAEILPRVFEPFFTTKEVGKGTGLGLATVYGIVKQHHGWLDVESEPGRGAKFRIGLPAVAARRSKPERDVGGEALPSGHETILVVEDEPALRSLVIAVLQRLGYRVLSAPSGVAALEVWKGHRDEVDLLLTDMVLPDGMTGGQLAERLRAERPDLKVIYTSGYSADLVAKGAELVEGVNYLQKPYDARRVAKTLRASLDEK